LERARGDKDSERNTQLSWLNRGNTLLVMFAEAMGLDWSNCKRINKPINGEERNTICT